MLFHVVIAMNRANQSEAIVSLNRDLEHARNTSRRIAAAWSQKFVRCRIKPMDLTRSQIESICEGWGRADALAGEPFLDDKLPKLCSVAYQRSFRAARNSTPPEGQP